MGGCVTIVAGAVLLAAAAGAPVLFLCGPSRLTPPRCFFEDLLFQELGQALELWRQTADGLGRSQELGRERSRRGCQRLLHRMGLTRTLAHKVLESGLEVLAWFPGQRIHGRFQHAHRRHTGLLWYGRLRFGLDFVEGGPWVGALRHPLGEAGECLAWLLGVERC